MQHHHWIFTPSTMARFWLDSRGTTVRCGKSAGRELARGAPMIINHLPPVCMQNTNTLNAPHSHWLNPRSSSQCLGGAQAFHSTVCRWENCSRPLNVGSRFTVTTQSPDIHGQSTNAPLHCSSHIAGKTSPSPWNPISAHTSKFYSVCISATAFSSQSRVRSSHQTESLQVPSGYQNLWSTYLSRMCTL